MIDQTLSLLASMYGAIGPGLFLVAAFPILVITLVTVMRVSISKARDPERVRDSR